jgi:hypothetical protein
VEAAELEAFWKMPKGNFDRGLIFCGQNSGKVAEEFFLSTFPSEDELEDDDRGVPVLLVQCPEKSSAKALLLAVLETILRDDLYLVVPKSARLCDLEKFVLHYLEVLKVEVLIFKDFDRLLSGRGQKEVLNALKSLYNQSRTAFILTGSEDLKWAVESDEQISRRFRWMLGR